MNTLSPEMEVVDAKLVVSPDKTDLVEVIISVIGLRCPAPGLLVNAMFIATIVSKSSLLIRFMGNQSTPLISGV